MSRGIPVELRCSFSPSYATVMAFPLKTGGYYIGHQTLVRAKRKMSIPEWSTVHLVKGSPVDELYVVAENVEHDEVITCAN